MPVSKRYARMLLITAIMLVVAQRADCQISEGGTPPSFLYAGRDTLQARNTEEVAAYSIASPFTARQLIEEDENAPEGTPYRLGILLAAGLEFPQDAVKSTLPGGEEIYRMRIKSDGAVALSLYYDRFEIPEGGKLYIYNNDRTQLLGAYTPVTNPDGKAFSSQFVAGSDITLEYAVPESGALPDIKISDIGYGYNHLEIRNSGTVDLSCMVNINCPEGDGWQDDKEGVIKMATRSGSSIYTCSASLLNNTSDTPTPYIYTAFHCLGSGTRQFTEDELRQAQFVFQYENTGCNGEETRKSTTLTGCSYLTGSDLSGGYDQALLLLTSNIPADLNPYMCGWDKSGNRPQSGAGIHHPNGSTKKISTYTSPATDGTWETSTETGAAGGHWVVYYAKTQSGHSVTAKGSSGSPLFDQNHKVVGSLTGGSSTCSYPNGSNYYGKIEKFFPRISRYLDPYNTGDLSVEGRYMRAVKPAPQNLTATYSQAIKGAELAWETDAEDEHPVSYIVYRNGYETGRTQAGKFSEAGLYPGLHEYTVAAVYDDGTISPDSPPATVKVHITAPPAGVEVKRTGEQATEISWEVPVPEQPVFWGEGSAEMLYRGTSLPLYTGQRWFPSDLEEIDRYTINKIEYYSTAGTEYELFIKNGKNEYTLKADPTATDTYVTKRITPFTVDAARSLMCGLKITSGKDFHFATDSYEAPDGREMLISSDGRDWASQSGLTHNLALKMFITPPTDTPENTTPPSGEATAKKASSRPVRAASPVYRIMRNGTEIAVTGSDETSYTDTGLEQGVEYTYTVTADYGNEGTASAAADPFLLKTESFDADIRSLTVNGAEITPDESGTYAVPLQCGTASAVINITAHPQASVTVNGQPGCTYTLETEAGGKYETEITVTSQSGENSNTYRLLTYKLPDNIIFKRWDDVLVVVNNPDNNGGLQFTGYKWFINGKETEYTEQHIYLPEGIDPEAVYKVEAVTTDGITLTSCGQSFPTEGDDIRLYPTFVRCNGEMTLYVKPDGSTYGKPATVYMTDMNGRTTTRQITGEYNTIKAPGTEGSYIITVVAPDGDLSEFKIRVKN